MRIFVTGAGGFIGSAVAEALARAGHEVRGMTRGEAKARALAARGIEPVIGSMEEPASYLPRAEDCEVAVHCAVEYSPRRKELEDRTLAALLGAAARAKAPRRFVYTSGVWVYGSTGAVAVDESSPPNPPAVVRDRPGHEQQVLDADGGLVRTLVLRPGCVFGGSGSLTSDWFASAADSGAARVVGPGENRWAMVHRDDLAELYVRAVEASARGEMINATDQGRFTTLECARAASRAAGAGGKVETLSPEAARKVFGPLAECLALDQRVDSGKAWRLLGWKPRHPGFVDDVESCHRAWKALRTEARP